MIAATAREAAVAASRACAVTDPRPDRGWSWRLRPSRTARSAPSIPSKPIASEMKFLQWGSYAARSSRACSERLEALARRHADPLAAHEGSPRSGAIRSTSACPSSPNRAKSTNRPPGPHALTDSLRARSEVVRSQAPGRPPRPIAHLVRPAGSPSASSAPKRSASSGDRHAAQPRATARPPAPRRPPSAGPSNPRR